MGTDMGEGKMDVDVGEGGGEGKKAEEGKKEEESKGKEEAEMELDS